MRNRLKKLSIAIPMFVMMFTGLAVLPTPVAAGGTIELGVCTFIPAICAAINPTDPTKLTPTSASAFLQSRLSTVLSFVFIGIILISVFIILRAGIKYIQSQGDPGKIAEAQKAISSVFIGIAVLFVGIIGLLLILAFFNLGGLTGSTNCVINPATQELTCPTTTTPTGGG